MTILNIIKSLGVPSILVAIFSFYIKKRDKEMSERQENLERYFKPLSLSYGFGNYDTQIPNKDLTHYTLQPFQMLILQGDVKAYSIFSYDKYGNLGGNQPYISSFDKIKIEQSSKDNYARKLNCIPEFINDDVYEFECFDSINKVHQVEMFAYYPVIEDYTGRYETFLVIYLFDKDNHNMFSRHVVDKFSAISKGLVYFYIDGVRPTNECAEQFYSVLSSFLSNYKNLRKRVKEELF